MGWFVTVVLFRGKDSTSTNSGFDNHGFENEKSDIEQPNFNDGSNFESSSPSFKIEQNSTHHHFLGYLLSFIFSGSARNWSRILSWAVLICSVVVRSYYNIYLENPIYL